ncbi:MAG TPA: carboxymuconolactone decarboxylase family protein [Streptosporangiaceae bacterium]|nr:carboxymuconolactone decarboxylase family protein [Streptosporangiaceae bacterium]
MSYLRTPDENDADDRVARLYAADLSMLGYVANYTKVFALRPDVYSAWAQLNTAIIAGMDRRRYELVTLAAARQLRSSYCALAHGKVLRDRYHDADTVHAIATDQPTADLEPVDMAIIAFAEKVVTDAPGITPADIHELRHRGLSDTDIFQIVVCAAARCFFSTVLDAVGAEPDAHYRTSLEPELQDALTFGRPIADGR